MAENHIVALCTVPDQATGEKLAHALVEARLAACVNLVTGVTSIYRWEGKVQKETECLLVIKTGAARFEELKRRIKELHPYDLPEVIAVPITAGSSEYLQWIMDSIAK